MRLHTIGNYQTTARHNFLLTVEGERLYAYVDTVGIPTIGVGINLREHGRLILQALGFDLNGAALTGAALAAEQGYISQLITAFGQSYRRNNRPNNQAFAAFNNILQQRVGNPVYPTTFQRVSTFELASTQISEQVLNQVLDGYIIPGKTFGGYEAVLDTWLTRTGVSGKQPSLMIRDSQERLALLSLAFNSRVYANDQPQTSWSDAGLPTLLGPNLARALLSDDRAEAWYEIRYNSGADARRFVEADTFSPYDSGALGDIEYKALYRTLTRHRLKIFGADRVPGTADDYETINQARLNTATAWGGALNVAVSTIDGHLASAQAHLVPIYGAGIQVAWQNIFVGEDQSTLYYSGTDSDRLDGTGQNDLIFGETGNDRIDGEAADDVLYGGAGLDRISGGVGDDWLIGGTGDDPLLDGGLGQDTYIWNSGDGLDIVTDVREASGIKGGTIQFLGQSLAGTKTQVDPLDPRVFTDTRGILYTLTGTPGVDGQLRVEMPGEAGGLDLSGFRSGDFGIIIPVPAPIQKTEKLGTENNDVALSSDAPEQTVFGLAGNDRIIVSHANSEGHGGGGHDFVTNEAGNQKLYGDAGSDILAATEGSDELYGGTDGDTLQGGADDDYLEGDDGDDVLDGGAGNDVIYGGEGNDFIAGGGTLAVATWEATSLPSFGTITLDGVTGPSGIVGLVAADDDGADFIDAGAGIDTIFAGSGSDFARGGAGNDLVVGLAHDDVLEGNDGDDALFGDGTEGQITIAGQSFYTLPQFHGSDMLWGGAGNDGLVGDGGADELYGEGDDDILSGDAAGLDESYHGADYLDGGDGNDTLFGFGKGDTLFGGAGNDTLEGDSSSVPWDKHGDDYLDGEEGDDLLKGDGGNDTLFGGDGADQLFGDTDDTPLVNQGDDYLDGEVGDDYLRSYAGNDTLFGGDGNDQLLAEAGDDYLDGEAGQDLMSGGEGNDTLYGGLDNDELHGDAGEDFLYGGDGDDGIAGGDGDDIIDGEAGFDVLVGGAGKDTYVFNRGDGFDVIVDTPADGNDAEASMLTLGEGIAREDVKFGLGSLVVNLGDGEGIHFFGFDAGDPGAVHILDAIEFADGTLMTYEDVLEQGFDIDGTEDDDVLSGTAVTDRIDAKGGNDVVVGGKGSDTLLGDLGDDWLEGGLGDDVADGGEGDDNLSGNGGADTLQGGAGFDTVTGNDGDDVLAGGADDDFLIGNDGADVYLFAAGDGLDVIEERAWIAWGIADDESIDVVRFDASVTAGEVALARQANGDLTIRYGAGDEITVRGQFDGTANAIERIEFVDGTFIDDAVIDATPVASIEGTTGDDALVGTRADDTLVGQAGADSYAVYLGMGRDTVVDASPSALEVGTLALAQGLTLDSLKARRVGDDLAVDIRGTADGVVIKDYFTVDPSAQYWQIQAHDGTTTPIQDLIDRPDPYADNVALSAREDFRNGLISGWASETLNPVLPTHAYVFSSWSQTTFTYLDNNNQPHSEVQDPVTFTDIQSYGVRAGAFFSPVQLVQHSIGVHTTSQVSDDEVIEALNDSTYETESLSYGVRLGGISMDTAVTTSSHVTFASGATSFNEIVSRTTTGWANIFLTQDGSGPDDTLTVQRITELRTVEDIVAGDSDNLIYGAEGIAAGHVALIEAGGGHDSVYAGPDDFVYANDGDDYVEGGELVYGGNGMDDLEFGRRMYGGAGDDWMYGGEFMAGGSGDDMLFGISGATEFYVDPAEVGADVVSDEGEIGTEEVVGWYLESMGVAFHVASYEPEEDLRGLWALATDSPTYNALNSSIYWRRDDPRYAEYETAGIPFVDYEWIAFFYVTLEDLRADLDFIGAPFIADDVRYMQPVADLKANDYAGLQPLYDAGVIELDTLSFGAGVSASDLIMTWGVADVEVWDDATGDYYVIPHAALEISWGPSASVSVVMPRSDDPIGTGIEQLRFDDGSTVTMAELMEIAGPPPTFDPAVPIEGTEQDDFLEGSAGQDEVDALAGDDYVATFEGDDLIAGGSGADTLDGGSGSDNYVFGFAEIGIDVLSDDESSTEAYFDQHYAELGILGWRWRADILHPGEYRVYNGLDYGIQGFPLYTYYDTYEEAVANAEGRRISYVEPASDTPAVIRRDDIAALQQLVEDGVLDKDVVDFGGGSSIADLSLTFIASGPSHEQHVAQPWHSAGVLQVRWNAGQAGFDLEVSDVDFGYRGGSIVAEDAYLLGKGIEAFRFGDGTELWLDEVLQQAELVVHYDDYLFWRYSGDQTISLGHPTIQFQEDITSSDVQVSRDGTDLLLTLTDGSAQGRLAGWYADPQNRPAIYLVFPDGQEIHEAQLTEEGLTVQGGGGDDVIVGVDGFTDNLYGGAGADSLYGAGAEDYLAGEEGDDTLAGGAGDSDFMEGGEGSDTYVFTSGDGDDTVFDWTETAGETDTVRLEGIAPSGVQVTRDDWSYYLVMDGADRLMLDSAARDPNARIERVEFDDGTVWTAADLEANVELLPATAGDDILWGTAGDDTIEGLDGDDFLSGNAGSDLLVGGEGGDLYHFAAGHGVDVVDNYDVEGSDDTLYFANAASTDTVLTRSGSDLLFTMGASGDQVRLLGWYAAADRKIDSVYFEGDGVNWDAAALELLAPVGGNSAPTVLNPISDQTADEDAAFNFTLPADAFADPDAGDTLTYSVGQLPSWVSFDAETRTLSGTPLQADVGSVDVTVTATDAGGLTAEDTFTITIGNVNDAPVVSAATATVLNGASVAASSLFSVTDEDGTAPTQYELYDSTAGNGHWEVGGIEQGVNVAIPVTGLTDVQFVAGSAIGSDLVWVRAYDGVAWSAWKSWTMNSWPHAANAAPVVTAGNAELLLNDSAQASTLFAVSDADGDPIVQYELWDDLAGGGYFTVDGVAQSNNPIPVAAADLADVTYVAGAEPGTEQVWARASDGMTWSAWKAWNITSALHVPNAAPTISATAVQTVMLGQAADAATLFAASDADGDPIQKYEFFDSTAGNGHFAVEGVEQGVNVGIVVDAADLADVQFVGSASSASDTVWVRASDGQTWGEWKSWTMNSWPHATNGTPVAEAVNASVLTNEAVAASSLFSVTDADGDAVARYELWDDVAGGGYWRVNGVQEGAGQAISVAAADLANAQYVGGASGGTEQVWVRANDGLEWGAWESWNMTTALHIPNDVPVVSAGTSTVVLGQSVDATSLFSVTDADGDPITKYEFFDSTAGNGHFSVDGVAAGVNVAIPVTAAQLAATQFNAGATIGSDLVWVRAFDGQDWSSWKSWAVNSWPHATNAAPAVTAENDGLLRGETVAASDLFSTSDADGDAAVRYELWDDVNGGGYWAVDGVQQAAAQAIGVDAADLADVQYVGGANAGTEQVWVRASDGMGWSAWKNWLMSTEGGMLRGGLGPDSLTGEAGPTVLEGGGGNDTIVDTEGNNAVSGGEGDDDITTGDGNDLIVGGAGNDTIHAGGGANVIAFNAGGGVDTLYSAAGAQNTLSLGGGISYDDLSLARDGNDLILSTGGSDAMVLKDWYAGQNNLLNLQIVHDASEEFDATSTDPLYNKKVQTFDFLGLVNEFDQALAASPGLTSWAVTNALLQFHLSGADDAALGGDLAYWYGKNGSLAGISLQAAQQVIGASGFGSDAQTLRPFSGLQEGFVKLS